MEREDLHLARRTLTVRRAGSGEPAVMIHGLGGSSLNWRDLAPLLAPTLDMWAPDLPGFGWSPPPRDGVMTPLGHAHAVVDLIDHMGRGPVHLFGNSLGGAVALQIAARRPDLVRSLTLLSPALPQMAASRHAALLPLLALPGIGESVFARMNEPGPEQRVQGVIDLCIADPAFITPERRARMVADVAERQHLTYAGDAMLQTLRGLLATFLDTGPRRPWKLAELVTAPTLLVYGQRDKLIDWRASHKATRHFRDASVLVLAESGHVPMVEHAPEVAAAWERVIVSRTSRLAS
jgi:pimeloyl-ACP methyl ester carboxylesterase